jgi:hypothetical protein
MTTTYPRPTDPASGFTRAAGTTYPHSEVHGRVDMYPENVLYHGAGGGVDDTAAFQRAINTGHRVHVPTHPTSGNYILKNKMTVTSLAGLHMTGDGAQGTGPTILCNGFPATTDVFEMTHAAFPQLRLDNLYFTNSSGTPPRDLFRLTVSQHSVHFSDIYVNGFSGYGYNSPAGMISVEPRLENCVFTFCLGGIYMDNGNASVLRNCRFAGSTGSFDLSIQGGSGHTVDSPVFDDFAPGGRNFDRMRIKASGTTIINPYVAWTPDAASGTLRNFYLQNGGGGTTIIGGCGVSTPSGGGYQLTPVDIDTHADVLLLNPPLAAWGGSGTYDLKVANSIGLVAFLSSTPARISVDAASQPYTTIYQQGRLLRYGQTISTALVGVTPDCLGARTGYFNNGGATNVTNVTGGQEGHVISLWAVNGNTTLMQAANGNPGAFKLQGGANYTLPSDAVITLSYFGGQWHEDVR